MGITKRAWEEALEKGFSSDKYTGVCYGCIDEPALKQRIKECANNNKCDYCKKKSKRKSFSVDLDTLIEFIMDGIRLEYVEFDDAQALYPGLLDDTFGFDVTSTADIVDFEGITDNYELREDIISSIFSSFWVEKHFPQLRPDQRLITNWEDFCKEVIKFRHVYFDTSAKENNDLGIEYISPPRLAKIIGDFVFNNKHYLQISEKSVYFRARNGCFDSARELGPPPKEECIYSNRMSEPGVPVFYGSFTSECAYNEVAQYGLNKQVSIGKFEILKKINVIDLSDDFIIPSLFDLEKAHGRAISLFMNQFQEDIAKPISKDRGIHHEYTPTQVVTKYLTNYFKLKGIDINGLIYPSASTPNERCIALFIKNEDCIGYDEKSEKKILRLLEVIKRERLG